MIDLVLATSVLVGDGPRRCRWGPATSVSVEGPGHVGVGGADEGWRGMS